MDVYCLSCVRFEQINQRLTTCLKVKVKSEQIQHIQKPLHAYVSMQQLSAIRDPPPPYTFESLCLTVLSDYQTDRTVTDNRKQEGECEHCVLRLCRYQHRQNKSPASNGSAKQKNVSADSDIWKMPNIDQYIGLGDLSVDHYILADIISTKHIFETPF